MGSKGSNTTVQNTSQSGTSTYNPSAPAMQAYQNVLNQAGQVGQLPYTPYTGELVAPVNQQQQAGIANVNTATNEAQPYIQTAAGMVPGAVTAADAGALGAVNAAGISGVGAVNTATAAGNQANALAQPIGTSQINQYENPYTSQVVQAAEAQFANMNAQQQQQVLGNAASQGALGGNRVGISQSVLAGQQAAQEGPVIAQLLSSGYGQALQEANTEQALGVGTALQAGQLGAATQLGAGQLGVGANLGAGQLASGTQLSAANTMGQLGVAGQTAAEQGAGAQIGAGTLEQQTQQAADTAALQQFQTAQAFPYQQTQWLAGVDTGVGSQMGGTTDTTQQGTQTTTAPPPSILGQVAGLGLAGTALAGGTGGFGQTGYLNPNSTSWMFSDRRAKENIKAIGKLNDGQTIYRFNYKGDPATQIGLMAQDVEKSHPEAVHEVHGIKAVDYDEATAGAVKRDAGGGVPGVGSEPWGAGQPIYGNAAPIPAAQMQRGNTIPQAPPRIQFSNPQMAAQPSGTDIINNAAKMVGQMKGAFSSQNQKPSYTVAPPASAPQTTDISGEGAMARGGHVPVAGFADGGDIFVDPELSGGFGGADAVRLSGGVGGADQGLFGVKDVVPAYAAAAPQSAPQARPPVEDGEGTPFVNNSLWANGRPRNLTGDPDQPPPTPPPSNDQASYPRTPAQQGPVAGVQAAPQSFEDYLRQIQPPRQAAPQARPGMLDSGSALWPALLSAGFGMMASKSPFPGVAIGEGGQKGVTTYLEQQQQEQAERYRQQTLDQAAQRMDTQARESAAKLALESKKVADAEKHAEDVKFPWMKDPNKPGAVVGVPGGPQDLERIRQLQEIKKPPLPGMSSEQREVQARQIAGGNMSPLVGLPRTAEGLQLRNALRNDAAEIIMREHPGMSLAQVADHMNAAEQEYKSKQIGLNSQARTAGQREANLNIILNSLDAAIPQALETSDKVNRTGFVPLNKIIRAGELTTSDANEVKYGMANLQLAEHWAKAMNPTGVMRESDRDKALTFLDTALSNGTYKAAVGQLRTQVSRERDAVHGYNPSSLIDVNKPTPEPGAGVAAPSDALPERALAQLKEGVITPFNNGQKWTKKNGQPVQVQ